MKTSIEQIESRLRQAPPPSPPPHLRHRLLEDFGQRSPAGSKPAHFVSRASWSRRWWPAIACSALAAVSLVVLGLQQWEIARLRALVDNLPSSAPLPPATQTSGATPVSVAGTDETDAARAELERLRSRASQLSTEVARMESLKDENMRLRSALTGATPAQVAQLAEARDKAKSIMCVNNLKQLGLAARLWATDHNDIMPPEIPSIRNEARSPQIMTCPGDQTRTAAASWEEFTPEHVSYEFLTPAEGLIEPNRVAFRCPIHGHVGLMDGSVHQISPAHQVRLFNQNGKTYLDTALPSPTGTNAAGQGDSTTPGTAEPADPSAQRPNVGTTQADRARFYNMDPQLAKRYGLHIQAPSEEPTNTVPSTPVP